MVTVAQLVEPRTVTPVVVGSSPISHPNKINDLGASGQVSIPEILISSDRTEIDHFYFVGSAVISLHHQPRFVTAELVFVTLKI